MQTYTSYEHVPTPWNFIVTYARIYIQIGKCWHRLMVMYKPHSFALAHQLLLTLSAGTKLNLKLKRSMKPKLKLKVKLISIMLNLSVLPPSPTMHPLFSFFEGNWRNVITFHFAYDPILQVPLWKFGRYSFVHDPIFGKRGRDVLYEISDLGCVYDQPCISSSAMLFCSTQPILSVALVSAYTASSASSHSVAQFSNSHSRSSKPVKTPWPSISLREFLRSGRSDAQLRSHVAVSSVTVRSDKRHWRERAQVYGFQRGGTKKYDRGIMKQRHYILTVAVNSWPSSKSPGSNWSKPEFLPQR